MAVNDGILIECVRVHPELYDKANAGFKNPVLKKGSWKNVAETVNASVTECQARWQALRKRFAKEKRMLELESSSGSKRDETAEMFMETLSNINKSMAVSMTPAAGERPPDMSDPDVLISRNVKSCLKSLTSLSLKMKYRRKFRDLIQDCEEEAAGVNVSG